ncbi:hypothetical protein [Micromonospora sp. NBC_01796]|uniref:hypothetical protein n=1 Tax=Micromonospora sp. NBC_01796 TaxID=2975987 RepID=UPI002DDAFD99|nr:hypothetical protein [Micromonospora sp. NBC_01796]WSA88590.1 hypothetical protein OIE47_13845 [Micromonospora sp. NBC_01796]
MNRPDIAAGTVLRLAAGEWSNGTGLPAETHLVIRVSRLHTDRAPEDAPGVWVTGHLLECEWPTSDCTSPCSHAYVYWEPLARAAAAE